MSHVVQNESREGLSSRSVDRPAATSQLNSVLHAPVRRPLIPSIYLRTFDAIDVRTWCVSGHSQAVFRNGIIATASKKQQEFFVEKLEGALG